MKPDWRGRLANWKFRDALDQLPEHHDMREQHEYEVLDALRAMFDNSGHFDGHVGTVVGCAVGAILERWQS